MRQPKRGVAAARLKTVIAAVVGRYQKNCEERLQIAGGTAGRVAVMRAAVGD